MNWEITDWSMDADAYFMCNAAVPSEALYPEASIDSRLVHKDWVKYPSSSRKQHPRRRRSAREVGPVVDRKGAVDDVGEEELDGRVGHHLAP